MFTLWRRITPALLTGTKLTGRNAGVNGSIEELMVLFPDVVAPGGRRLACQTLEEPGKIGGVLEAE